MQFDSQPLRIDPQDFFFGFHGSTMSRLPSLRTLVAIALVALVPVAAYIASRTEPVVSLSLVSVCVIALSLYWMFGPASETPSAH